MFLVCGKKVCWRKKQNKVLKLKELKYVPLFLKGSIGRLVKFAEFTCKVSLKIKKMDVVHCHDFHPLPAMIINKILFRSNSYVIYDAHEYESQKLDLGNGSKFFIKLLERISSYFVDGFITVSEPIMEAYHSLYLKTPKTLVLNCPCYQDKVESNRLQTLLSIPNEEINCLYQGGFLPYRGIEELTQAFL